MDKSTSDRERRGHARIAPKGSVALHVANEPRRGRIANISASGMFVADLVEPSSWTGRSVDFDIRFDGARAEWLRGTGRIVRVSAAGFAIAFDDPTSQALLRAIDELTTASHAHDRRMSVVLVDSDAQRRAAIAEGFRATGCAVEEVATPLEAIHRLGANNFDPDVIAVADSQPSADADELRTFVERDHPHGMLITIGDELLSPLGNGGWLSSADPKADLAARIREILVHHGRRE
jgi:CheY-like chemotaxis protein